MLKNNKKLKEWQKSKKYLQLKNVTIPTTISYLNKGLIVVFYSTLIFIFLHLLGYSWTGKNFLACIALYFILQELKDYLPKKT
jgi:hypothetical protein